jgi:hypothetical protein
MPGQHTGTNWGDQERNALTLSLQCIGRIYYCDMSNAMTDVLPTLTHAKPKRRHAATARTQFKYNTVTTELPVLRRPAQAYARYMHSANAYQAVSPLLPSTISAAGLSAAAVYTMISENTYCTGHKKPITDLADKTCSSGLTLSIDPIPKVSCENIGVAASATHTAVPNA